MNEHTDFKSIMIALVFIMLMIIVLTFVGMFYDKEQVRESEPMMGNYEHCMDTGGYPNCSIYLELQNNDRN